MSLSSSLTRKLLSSVLNLAQSESPSLSISTTKDPRTFSIKFTVSTSNFDVYNPDLNFNFSVCIIWSNLLGFSKLIEFWCRTVYDVSVADDNWSKDVFDVVSGNISQSWERLDAWVIYLLLMLLVFESFVSRVVEVLFTFAVVVFFHIRLNWRPKFKACFMVHLLWLVSGSLQSLLFRFVWLHRSCRYSV